MDELAVQCKTDPARLGDLWTACERLVRYWAVQYIKTPETRLYDTDDLIQSGFLALVDAVRGFDPERSAFATYLRFHVRARFAEVAGRRDGKLRPEIHAVSLDAPLSDENDETLLDTLADPRDAYEAADERVWRDELHREINASLDSLPDGGEILRERYYNGSTLKELAERGGVTPERVRQRERKSLQQMRTPSRSKRLKPFIEEITNFYMHVGVERFRRTGTSAVEEIIQRWEKFAE